MKGKKNIHILIYILAVICLVMSCSGTYILASIENEVKLKPATANGTITSIVKIGGNLYVSNGLILTKPAFSEGDWKEVSKPVNAFCTSLATDGKDLYASFIDNYKNDGLGAWKYSNGSWQKISGSDGIQAVIGNGTVFGTKNHVTTLDSLTVSNENLDIYKIDSNSASKIKSESASSVKHIAVAGGNYFSTTEGLFNDSGAKVSGAPAGIKAIDSEGKYFLTDDKLYKLDNWSSGFSHGANSPTDAVVLEINNKKYILVSENGGGFIQIKISDNITECKRITENSSESVIKNSAQYKASVGKNPASKIFAESKNGKYYIYLSIHDSHYAKYTGLWGFYSESTNHKNEWNRE